MYKSNTSVIGAIESESLILPTHKHRQRNKIDVEEDER